MSVVNESRPKPAGRPRGRLWRLAPLLVLVAILAVVYAMGWHRQISLETLLAHRARIDDFISDHRIAAAVVFAALYAAAALLVLPTGFLLAVLAGFLFGAAVGGFTALVGSTAGATVMFLVARSAFGEHLLRGIGPRAARFAAGFRADAWSYIVFLRLVPTPSWLTNVAAALFEVRPTTFIAATALGRTPGSFTFAFLGAGLGSVIDAQQAAYRACLTAGGGDCRIDFDPANVLTPTLLAALIALGLLALVPVAARRLRSRRAQSEHS
jgi:uncharacterized membrane protein YdjX (TVP38/TMEM64 family)